MSNANSSIRLSGKEKIGLISNLATMLKAGIPILEAVDSLLDEAKGNQKKVLQTLRSDLRAGNFIHTTFRKFPKVFDRVTVNLIKASEEAGSLETTLVDVRRSIQKEMEFGDKVRSAMMYPMFISLVFVGVLGVMLIVVIPKISKVFLRLNLELPFATRMMITMSNALIENTWWVLGGIAVIILSMLVLFRYQRELIMKVLLSFPVVSGLTRQIDLTRFSRSLYLLLSSGMPIATALELSEGVMVKPEMRTLIRRARKNVMSGKRFAEGLHTKRSLIPGMIIKLIEVGEKSGSLDEAMKDIAEKLDYDVSKNLKAATALLEPLMLVAVGLAVGVMMMAIIAPIYGLISSVGAR